jgi:hypothetical protein
MGEARRKRLAMAADWVQLSPGLPARVALSRPSSRPATTRQYERGVAADIAAAAATNKPTLCFNFACDSELLTPPAVLAFLKATDDPHIPPIAMGVCEQCAQKSDDELRAIIKKTFAQQFELGEPPPEAAKVEIIVDGLQFVVDRVPILVVGIKKPPICAVATAFSDLLEAQKLPRFLALRNGIGNCHSVVKQLYLDMKELGIADMFAFKRGSCTQLRNEYDPKGLHSWIEADGWAIDVSNGATGRPVLIMPVEDYYTQMQITDAFDVAEDEQ